MLLIIITLHAICFEVVYAADCDGHKTFPEDFMVTPFNCTIFDGYLYIKKNPDELTMLERVTEKLTIESENVNNLDGLSALRSVGSLILEDVNVANVDFLKNLETATSIWLHKISELENVDGLSGLKALGYSRRGFLHLNYLPSLKNVDGFSNLFAAQDFLGGQLNLYSLKSLENIDGFRGLKSVNGDLKIAGGSKFSNLKNLESLSELTTIGGSLIVSEISNLSGLEQLETVGGDIKISYPMDGLDACVFENLESVGGGVSVEDDGRFWGFEKREFNTKEQLQTCSPEGGDNPWGVLIKLFLLGCGVFLLLFCGCVQSPDENSSKTQRV